MDSPTLRIRIFLAATCLALVASPGSSGEEESPGALLRAFQRESTSRRALELARAGEAATPQLKAALAGPGTRALTAWALSRHPVSTLRGDLENLLPGGDQVAGFWAARALESLADPRSLAPLASRLARKPRNYWELARWTGKGYRPIFHRIRQGRDETIFATPDIPNLRVACASMEALGSITGEESMAVLGRALRSEQHLVRYGAVRGFRRLSGQKAIEAVKAVAAMDPVLYVRRAAERALREMEWRARNPATPFVVSPPGRDRLRQVPSIAFIKAKNRTESNLGFRDSYFFPKTPWYAWGENLYTLTPPAPGGELRNLTRLPPGGAVQGPEVSRDGRRILVGLRQRQGEPFHIHEITVDTGEIKQLTHGAANDVDPCYLPDGRIAFSSDRDGTLEYYHQERARAIYVMEKDGGGLGQITFNPNQDYEPLALRDGRILYSSYRFYGQDGSGGVFSKRPGSIARIETQLRAVRPDGVHDSHFYGSRRGGFYVPLRELPDGDQFQAPSLLRNKDHLGVSVSQARELDDGRLVCITPAGLTVVDPRCDPRDCEIPIFPEVVNLAGGEEVYIHNHDDMNPVGRYTSPYPLDGSLVLVSHAPWHRRGGSAYGIYLLDLETGKKILVYDDPQLSDVDPIPLVHREKEKFQVRNGPVLPQPPESTPPTGTIVILSVFNSDLDFDRSRVRYLRVLSAERLGVSMNANGGFRSRILGTVPIEEDGSAHVEVPADTPLHFNLLDENESILVHETAFISVRPGERRTCIGCHEPATGAPTNRMSKALLRPPYRALETGGDLIYMGNVQRSYSVIYR